MIGFGTNTVVLFHFTTTDTAGEPTAPEERKLMADFIGLLRRAGIWHLRLSLYVGFWSVVVHTGTDAVRLAKWLTDRGAKHELADRVALHGAPEPDDPEAYPLEAFTAPRVMRMSPPPPARVSDTPLVVEGR